MDPGFLAMKFSAGLAYDAYVETGTDEQRRRWEQVYEAARVTDGQRELVSGFTRPMRVLVVSGIWCGDCVQQCPLIQRLAEVSPEKVDLKFVDRDEHRNLAELLRINAGDRVPVAVFMAEDHERCSVFGDRTLSRYRALARKQLGAACPVAIGPPDKDELAATMQDWCDELERVHLMLRLSGRLREKYGD